MSEHEKRCANCEHDPGHFAKKQAFIQIRSGKTFFQKLADVPWMYAPHKSCIVQCKVALLRCQELHVNRATTRSSTTSRCSKVTCALCHMEGCKMFCILLVRCAEHAPQESTRSNLRGDKIVASWFFKFEFA